MTTPPQLLSSCGPRDVRLEVEFVWSGDRFQHFLYRREGTERTPLCVSIMNDTEEGAALVELLPQLSTAPHPTLFLHGAGGGAQWSMSVEAAVPCELRFDVAARVLAPPVDRILAYRFCHEGDLVAVDTGGATEAVGRAGRQFELVTHVPADAALPVTLRWQYSFRITPG